MVGVRLGGIDPSILRELSGVYKPFVKAFKELVSNAFDADAEKVSVTIADDLTSIIVADDGSGMTPFEFRNDFTRIGGGSRRWLGERTSDGRLRIGSKGIGFLALARYCSSLEVESNADRKFVTEFEVDEVEKHLDLTRWLGFQLPTEAFARRVKCSIEQVNGKIGKLREGQHYRLVPGTGEVSFMRPVAGPLRVKLSVDSKGLVFRAALDFDRLLILADKADLEKIENFAAIELEEVKGRRRRGTTITIHNLKDFVRRELRAARRKGNVRNIASQAGLDRFLWQLSRCTPVAYRITKNPKLQELKENLPTPPKSNLKKLEVKHSRRTRVLTRPVYPLEPDSQPLHDDMLIPVAVEEAGLRAKGVITGYESVIFPAEYRGITVRVRGVAIGEPGFFGAEDLLTGANKAALSQITGEINVLSGLDAAESLNPGRESFYEESPHYKALRMQLVGDGERVAGFVGRAISAVLRRSQVRSALKDVIGRAELRRRAMNDVSAAVAHMVASGGETGTALRGLLKKRKSKLNGLTSCPEFEITVPARVGGLQIVATEKLDDQAEIDYLNEHVRLDTSRPEWDWSIQFFDRRFQVENKKGGANRPLAELDLKANRVLVNWEHPVRMQMDERAFLRTALSWLLAKEAAVDRDQMMDLALRLLSFQAGTE